MTKGAPLKVPYIDPVSWLDHILQQSPAVHQVYLQKLTEFPPEQAEWRVVIYTDEVTPDELGKLLTLARRAEKRPERGAAEGDAVTAGQVLGRITS